MAFFVFQAKINAALFSKLYDKFYHNLTACYVNCAKLKVMEDILLVDDDFLTRHVAATCLRNAGLNVCEVENGPDAIAKAQRQKFGLIFMDYYMPNMHGCAAARHIRNGGQCRHTPIIALTGEADCERFFQAGMNAYLRKPLHENTLIETAQKWLSAGCGMGMADENKRYEGAEILDLQRLNLLISTIGKPQVLQLMRRFIADISVEGPVYHDLQLGGDANGLSVLAHRHASAAATFGFYALALHCRKTPAMLGMRTPLRP